MSNLHQVRERLTRTWDTIANGWRELREIEVALEVPGLEPGDFEIEVNDDILVVRGEKKVSRQETHGHYYVLERAYGRFERAIKLPARVDDITARARYRRGVLTVSLPKIAGPRGRRIAVEAR